MRMKDKKLMKNVSRIEKEKIRYGGTLNKEVFIFPTFDIFMGQSPNATLVHL